MELDAAAVLKLHIAKGTNLVVRDFWSSDPYVVARLGHQKVQTRAVKNSLNPVWNEDLTLFVPHSEPLVLKLEMFDRDRIGRDDKMGSGEVDLSDLATAARMLKASPSPLPAPALSSSVAMKNKDDYSSIKCVDEHLVQEVCLRLQNVESGQLELYIKWIDLPH